MYLRYKHISVIWPIVFVVQYSRNTRFFLVNTARDCTNKAIAETYIPIFISEKPSWAKRIMLCEKASNIQSENLYRPYVCKWPSTWHWFDENVRFAIHCSLIKWKNLFAANQFARFYSDYAILEILETLRCDFTILLLVAYSTWRV